MENYLKNKCSGCGKEFKKDDRIIYIRSGIVSVAGAPYTIRAGCVRVKLQPSIKPSGLFHVECFTK